MGVYDLNAPVAGYPLLIAPNHRQGDAGQIIVERVISLTSDPYLVEHPIDNVSVVPAAVACELMAESVASLWSDRAVTELRDVRALKGIRLQESEAVVEIVIKETVWLGESLAVSVDMRPYGGGLPHYRAVVRLSKSIPESPLFEGTLAPSEAPLSAWDAYESRLFHGPCFQVMREFVGLDQTGALVAMSPTRPKQWLGDNVTGEWLFDPGLLDAGPQMAIVWAHALRGETALPSRFGRIRRYGATPIGWCHMYFMIKQDAPEHTVRADVAFVDESGRVRLSVEDLESTSSESLNRLGGGWRGEIVVPRPAA